MRTDRRTRFLATCRPIAGFAPLLVPLLALPVALIRPAMALASTGPAPTVDPLAVDPWESIRPLLIGVGILVVAVAVVVAAVRLPAVRPFIVFFVVAGTFAVAAMIVDIGVSFTHMDAGMTDAEHMTLNLEVGALFVAGIVLGALAARKVRRHSR
jgi:TctA family transporter